MTKTFDSTPLDQWIALWLAHQRSLGRGYELVQWILRHLQRFQTQLSAIDLTQTGFDLWCDSFCNLSPTTRRQRQMVVRKFCLYRRRTQPACFVPDPLYFVRLCPYRRPVIIEPEQIAHMLFAADRLAPTPNSPLLPAITRLAIVLLYTAGLRRGELVRLTMDDVSSHTGVVRIRTSKFHKSRLVPLSSDASNELRAYLCKRLAPGFDQDPHSPLLCNRRGGQRGYSGNGIAEVIHRMYKAANVVDSEHRRPRVHDMRHSFAVNALLRWYREGADVQSNLPRLAMYMGHVSIVSTAHYLPFVPTLRVIASERFEQAFGNLIQEIPT